jgi:23S rRNA pseudouridine1911/1915/1917 synthase
LAHTEIIIADRGDAGRRLDLVLRRHLRGVKTATRTRIQAWIADGRVTVSGVTVRRTASRAAVGDIVTVRLPPTTLRTSMAAEESAIRVLFEDDYLLAIDKPAGVVVHPAYKHATGTMMNALLWHARDWKTGDRPSLVGRLDKQTSGIVVVAKTATVHAALQRTWRESEKDYLAVVHGRVNVARGEIDLRLARDRRHRRMMVASTTAGAPSITRFVRLARGDRLSLLRCRLITGRTHQIRVHLAARGWPLVGDRVYGNPGALPSADPEVTTAVRAFPRQALHAWRMTLTHPVTRDRLSVEAPVPPDIERLLAVSGLIAGRADRTGPTGFTVPTGR